MSTTSREWRSSGQSQTSVTGRGRGQTNEGGHNGLKGPASHQNDERIYVLQQDCKAVTVLSSLQLLLYFKKIFRPKSSKSSKSDIHILIVTFTALIQIYFRGSLESPTSLGL